ncbi:MAG TPA: hypothetical protein VI306_12270 [Pyrinomonadaceae bacterium]
MAKNSSATARVETPHAGFNRNDITQNSSGPDSTAAGPTTADGSTTDVQQQTQDVIKQRARALIDNEAIDTETRSILKYGLEIDDPVLEELVCMVEQGESLDDNLPTTNSYPDDEFITTHRSRNELTKSERIEERLDAMDAREDYSIEYEATERESMLAHERDDEFPEESADDLATDAGNGNRGGSGAGNVCSSSEDEPEPFGRFSECESFALFENGLIEDPLDDVEEIDAKLKKLISLICRAGNEPDIKSAALLSLLATLWYAPDFVNTAKHLAFLHCCEVDLYGVVDRQIEMIEQALMASEGT